MLTEHVYPRQASVTTFLYMGERVLVSEKYSQVESAPSSGKTQTLSLVKGRSRL